MFAKCILVAFIALFALASAKPGFVAPAAYIAPYATSYNAHYVNHAIAAPLVAAPAAYAAAPYAYSPYAYSAAYSAPLVYGK